MTGIKNLSELLRSMNPKQVDGEYVYCTASNDYLPNLKNPLLVYREDEGITFILKKEDADALSLNYSGTWGLITLSVHSDLSAIGLLATIADKLAKAGIAVNAVSAYYHDHLFVPIDKINEALNLLRKISKSN